MSASLSIAVTTRRRRKTAAPVAAAPSTPDATAPEAPIDASKFSRESLIVCAKELFNSRANGRVLLTDLIAKAKVDRLSLVPDADLINLLETHA